MCTAHRNQSTCHIKVDFSEGPWGFYATQLGITVGEISIPINAIDLAWLGDPESTYADLEAWELNARNVFAELYGVIADRKEYAIADSIGIAYSPYNRRDSVGESWSGISVKAQLLRGSGTATAQYAIGFKDLDSGNWVMSGARPSTYADVQVFQFTLIVAYGVEHGYLWDPSFGSQNYAHRTLNGETYFRNPGLSDTAFGYLHQYGLVP